MANLYSQTYTYTTSSGKTGYIRSYVSYSTSTGNNSFTVSGTVYLQYKGTFISSTTNYYYFGAVSITGYGGNKGTYTAAYTLYPNKTYSDWTTVKSKAFSFTAETTTSTKSQTLYAALWWDSTTTAPGTYTTTYGKTAALTVPTRKTYSVTYNANGGTNAPSAQTKYYGVDLKLSSGASRTNYAFKQWNTKADGTGTAYSAGGTYTGNAALTLYAIWYPPYTVTYDANGGTGAPAPQVKVHDKTLVLSTTVPTKEHYGFMIWSEQGASYNAYRPGGNFTGNRNLALVADWTPKPSILSLTVVRCDSRGIDDDEGHYARVTCEWYIVSGGRIKGTVTPRSGGSTTDFSFSSSSGSGSVTSQAIIGSDNGMEVDPDMQYTIEVTVGYGVSWENPSTRSVILTKAFFVMDFKEGGTGIGIGTPAPATGMQVGYDAVFEGDVEVDGDLTVSGDAVVSGLHGVRLPDPNGGGAYSEIWSNSYGAHFIVVCDSSGTPLYRYYFSQSENIAVQKYDTSTSTYDAAKYYVRGTSVLFHNNFNTTSVDVPIGSIAANGGTKWITYSVAKTGYTPIAISGWYLDGASTLQIYCLRLSGTDASIALRNPNSSASSSSAIIHVQVLYAKTAT